MLCHNGCIERSHKIVVEHNNLVLFLIRRTGDLVRIVGNPSYISCVATRGTDKALHYCIFAVSNKSGCIEAGGLFKHSIDNYEGLVNLVLTLIQSLFIGPAIQTSNGNCSTSVRCQIILIKSVKPGLAECRHRTPATWSLSNNHPCYTGCPRGDLEINARFKKKKISVYVRTRRARAKVSKHTGEKRTLLSNKIVSH